MVPCPNVVYFCKPTAIVSVSRPEMTRAQFFGNDISYSKLRSRIGIAFSSFRRSSCERSAPGVINNYEILAAGHTSGRASGFSSPEPIPAGNRYSSVLREAPSRFSSPRLAAGFSTL